MNKYQIKNMSQIEINDEIMEKDIFPWYTEEEKSVFAAIDREQEDRDVVLFQKTKDALLFEKIYKNRIPTLQIWARKNHYMMDSQDDMFGELNFYFSKAVFTYDHTRGPFNNCLFIYLLNCLRNIYIGRKAKKRLPAGLHPNDFKKFMLSLDYSYDGKNGSENSLKDVLSNSISTKETQIKKMNVDETIKILSNGDSRMIGWLRKLGDGNTVASLVKESKTRKGNISISISQVKKLNGRRGQKRVVSTLIKEKTNIQDDFLVIDYGVENHGKLSYTIEMKKTKDSDLILKTIRRLRKDKEIIMNKIEA